MAFEFDIHAKRHPSDEEILKGIRKFVRSHKDGPATLMKFLAWPDRPCGESAIYKRFGSWRKALRKSFQSSENRLIEALKKLEANSQGAKQPK